MFCECSSHAGGQKDKHRIYVILPAWSLKTTRASIFAGYVIVVFDKYLGLEVGACYDT